MSRFLLLSECGDGLGLAIRLIAEGHQVVLWLRDRQEQGLGKGLVDEAKRYEKTVIADSVGFGPLMDALRESEFRTFAGSSFADELEDNREFAEEIMTSNGIQVPRSKLVKSVEEARDFIESLGSDRVFIKPTGNLSGAHPSEEAKDSEDVDRILGDIAREYKGDSIELEIQEFIPGIALSTEGWFNGHNWIPGMFNHTLERKQSLAGDLGPPTGCTGNLVWSCGEDEIVKATLLRVTDVLREHNYVGPLDINCIISEGGLYGLEFTPRFGYDAFPTLLYALCEFDFGDFIETCSRGDMPSVSLKDGFAAGVRLMIPKDAQSSAEIRGLELEDLGHFYPYSVSMSDLVIQSVGKGGDLGVLTGFCHTVSGAFSVVYDLVGKLQVKDLQYRSDLADVFYKEFYALRDLITDSDEGWVGFDLDGTLAEYASWSEDIGKPVPEVIARLKKHLAEGDEVRILTARGSYGTEDRWKQLRKIHDWLLEHVGKDLEVTDRKDPKMKFLYDDRVIRVDEGEIYDEIPIRN